MTQRQEMQGGWRQHNTVIRRLGLIGDSRSSAKLLSTCIRCEFMQESAMTNISITLEKIMTYKNIESVYPEEFQRRQNDKLTYHYPRGVSYMVRGGWCCFPKRGGAVVLVAAAVRNVWRCGSASHYCVLLFLTLQIGRHFAVGTSRTRNGMHARTRFD